MSFIGSEVPVTDVLDLSQQETRNVHNHSISDLFQVFTLFSHPLLSVDEAVHLERHIVIIIIIIIIEFSKPVKRFETVSGFGSMTYYSVSHSPTSWWASLF